MFLVVLGCHISKGRMTVSKSSISQTETLPHGLAGVREVSAARREFVFGHRVALQTQQSERGRVYFCHRGSGLQNTIICKHVDTIESNWIAEG